MELRRSSKPSERIERAELLDLYRVAIDEYRFETQLNWNRTQYYLVLNTAIFAAGAALAGAETYAPSRSLVPLIFAIGSLVALLGRRNVATGHDYYRRAVYKKTLIEAMLGFVHKVRGYSYAGATISIGTTLSMEETEEILNNTEAWLARPIRKTTITRTLIQVLGIIAFLDIVAAILFFIPVAIEVWSFVHDRG